RCRMVTFDDESCGCCVGLARVPWQSGSPWVEVCRARKRGPVTRRHNAASLPESRSGQVEEGSDFLGAVSLLGGHRELESAFGSHDAVSEPVDGARRASNVSLQ